MEDPEFNSIVVSGEGIGGNEGGAISLSLFANSRKYFGILAAVVMRNTIVWIVTPCSPL
jgi:hypothetical protein